MSKVLVEIRPLETNWYQPVWTDGSYYSHFHVTATIEIFDPGKAFRENRKIKAKDLWPGVIVSGIEGAGPFELPKVVAEMWRSEPIWTDGSRIRRVWPDTVFIVE